MESIADCFARNLKKYRQRDGLTQSELAQKCGLSTAFLQSLESGRKWVGPSTVECLASALQISQSDLFSQDVNQTDDIYRVMKMVARQLGFELSDRTLARAFVQTTRVDLAHVPADVRTALLETCSQPKWDWSGFRKLVKAFKP